MKTIEEIMGLVASAIESAELGEYESHTGREFDSAQHKQDCKDIVKEIESALRELVERKPLDQKVALKMWMEAGCIDHESGGIELIRKVERAHGIGA